MVVGPPPAPFPTKNITTPWAWWFDWVNGFAKNIPSGTGGIGSFVTPLVMPCTDYVINVDASNRVIGCNDKRACTNPYFQAYIKNATLTGRERIKVGTTNYDVNVFDGFMPTYAGPQRATAFVSADDESRLVRTIRFLPPENTSWVRLDFEAWEPKDPGLALPKCCGRNAVAA